jgi:putative mRNA 3-end processing factor
MTSNLLQVTSDGLYCAAGDFHIDPWRPVKRAIITHAHSDHARWGCRRYLTSTEGERVLRMRMEHGAAIQAVNFGEPITINDVRVSLHPAGHILGSAQIRVEHRGEVWVVAGDYKTQPDPTCSDFELVMCHTFITESTFGLPIYRWRPQQEIFDEINAWWKANQAAGRTSVLMGYALGKAQRLIAGVDASIGPIYTHGAVESVNAAYRETGIALPATTYVTEATTDAEGKRNKKVDWSQGLVIAPPSAQGTPWLRKFGEVSLSFASGWMQIRDTRKQRSVDRGFTLSDHVDWPSLIDTVKATGAQRVWVTHGYTAVVARYLNELGLQAEALQTRFEGEESGDTRLEIGD